MAASEKISPAIKYLSHSQIFHLSSVSPCVSPSLPPPTFAIGVHVHQRRQEEGKHSDYVAHLFLAFSMIATDDGDVAVVPIDDSDSRAAEELDATRRVNYVQRHC